MDMCVLKNRRVIPKRTGIVRTGACPFPAGNGVVWAHLTASMGANERIRIEGIMIESVVYCSVELNSHSDTD